MSVKSYWHPIARAWGLGLGAWILVTTVCAGQSLWTPVTNNWQPGTLIPHRYVIHHHGMTDGAGEWVPDYASIATMQIDASARWSEIFAETVPGSADVVLIPYGVTVTYDQVSTQAFKALVLRGTLEFDPNRTTKLTVGTIVVDYRGVLRITPANRTNVAEVVYSGPLNVNEDPRQFSVGLVVFGGEVDVSGTPIRSCYAAIRSTWAGASWVPVWSLGWRPGDVLVFPDQQTGADPSHYSFPERYVSQTEYMELALVRPRYVTFTQPLQYGHTPARQGWVGMLTRNVVFRSDLEAGVRAHTMFEGHASIRFNYAALVDMGRTTVEVRDDTTMDETGQPLHIGQNQRARYALHAHHVHLPVTFHGNTIYGQRTPYGSERFGIVLHDSRGDIRSNVVVGARGSGIFLEDGSETGEVTENLVVGVGGGIASGDDVRFASLEGQDMGFGGFGIWARGPLVKIRRNIATGYFNQAAYAYYTHNNFVSGLVPDIPGTPEELSGQEIRVSQTPIQVYGAFDQNLALGLFRQALALQYLQPETNNTIIRNFTVVMIGTNSQGVHLHHCTGVTLENVRIYGPYSGFGIVNNAGTETRLDVVGGVYAFLDVGIATTPRGGRIINPRFWRNYWNIVVAGGSGQVEVYRYLGWRRNCRLYADPTEAPGPTLEVRGIRGYAMPF